MIHGAHPDRFAIELTYKSNTYKTTITCSQLSQIIVGGEKERRFVEAIKASLRDGFWVGISSMAAMGLLKWISAL